MIFEKAVRNYQFDLDDTNEQEQIEEDGERLEIQEPTRKRKRMSSKALPALPSSSCSNIDDEYFEESQRF